MGKTISTHNGSTVSREHNIRNPKVTDKQEHIDRNLIYKNEILHDEKPREAYERIFGEALRRYNEKQTRDERKIHNYYAHVEKDAKKHPVYEMIVQIGDRNDTGIDAPVERECLREFYEGWKERNPNLECIGAYIHADESDGTIHMHIDYVPVATGYKRGLEKQNGLVKALEQQGFEGTAKITAQIKWEARENAVLEQICNDHGIEVVHPKEQGRKHLHTETYKAEKRLEELKEKIDIAEDVVEKSWELKTTYELEAENVLVERLMVEEEVSNLKNERASLEGEIELLKVEKDVMEQKLPVLKEQISEAETDLEVVESAIKRKTDEGRELFGWSGMDERLARARQEAEKDNKIKALEKKVKALEERLSIFQQFVSQPKIQQWWNEFLHLLGRDKKEKTIKKDEIIK